MTIDEAIERMINKSKLMSSNQAKEDWLQIAEWLEELKIFQELYPDADGKGSLVTNYNNGWNDAIEKVGDVASWNQKGLGGYYSITSEELEAIKNIQVKS